MGREATNGSLAVPSEALGLELRFEDDRLRLWDPAAQEYLLEYAEEHDGRVAAEQRVHELELEAADLKKRLRGHG